MTISLAFIGFGEAGSTFAGGILPEGRVRAYDRKTDDAACRDAMLAAYRAAGVAGCASAAEALADADIVLCLVTADQTLDAARGGSAHIKPGALWFDMNSVAPDTKRAAASMIETAGGRYVDVAIMAPVNPARHSVPLLLSGQHAEEGVAALKAAGFSNAQVTAGEVGRASAIKMIRSVMVKGIEALTAECTLAAHRAGVVGEVLSSLGDEWAAKADYNLDRMLVHGLRRAAEMEEVAATLSSLGVEPLMTRGTIARERAAGGLLINPVPSGIDAKLERLDAI